jgi:hypothetical protein
MTPRTRKLVGTVLLFTFLAVYAFGAMMVAIALQVRDSRALELTYYVAAGLLWVVPAAWLVSWMHRLPAREPGDEA